MTDDVVAELDRWLASPERLFEATVGCVLIQAARDEIVALRQLQLANVEGNKWLRDNDERVFLKAIDVACTQARDAALEEAARIAENGCLVPPDGGSPTEEEREMCEHIAAAIRALKER